VLSACVRGLACVKRDCVVIRICYKDFSAGTHDVTGLHGRAQSGPRGVTVYLVPGLSSCQRKAVIRRLRQEASRYVGPALPLPQLAMALGLDRVRSAARVAGAVVRLHPAVTLLPSALVAALMTLFVLASADGAAFPTGQRTGLADAAAVGPGVPQGVTEAVVPVRATVATPAAAGGLPADSGQQALGGRAQPRTRPGSRPVPLSRGPAGFYACPPVVIGPVAVAFPGQLACGPSASQLAPYTAHLPDPRAFAT
jgi:hypothetical protein